jgi:hypothetical protein
MDTDRKFDIQSTDRTGISADKDVRSVALLKGKSKNLLVIANNDDALQTYEYE